MSVRSWHPGKLVLLWAWGAVLVVVAFTVLSGMETPTSGLGLALGFVLIVALVGIPAVLSVLTWVWLGGREGEEAADEEGPIP